MSWKEDPPRLVAQGGDDSLRELIQAGREDLPSEEQLHHLASRLAPWMGGPGDPSSSGGGGGVGSGAAGGGAASLPVAKVIVALALSGAAVGGGVLALRPAQVPAQTVQSAPSQVEPPIETTVVKVPAASTTADPSESVAARATPAPTATASTAEQGLSEIALLQQAQAELGGNPGRALALTQQHARRFPGGALSQEREAIAIQALAGLGRTAEARARAERFAAAFPGSAYVRRFEVLLGPVRRDAGGLESLDQSEN